MKDDIILKLILVLFSLTLFTSLLSTSVLAQPISLTPKMIVMWTIGIIDIIIGFTAFYYLFTASKLWGGKLGSGLYKLNLTIISLIIVAIILGVSVVLNYLEIKVPDTVYISAAFVGLLTALLSIFASRAIINSTKI